MTTLAPAVITSAKSAPRQKLEKMVRHLEQRDWPKARALSSDLLKKYSQDINVLALASRVALDADRKPELALRRARAALKLAPDAAEAHRGVVAALTALGDRDGVADAAERWIAAHPTRAAGYYELAKSAPKRCGPYLPAMRALCAAEGLDGVSRALLLNALGLVLEKEGRRTEAFEAFRLSKLSLGRSHDAAGYRALLEACREVYTPQLLADLSDDACRDERMVFIVGLPRTGSTLIERVLCGHPSADALGEARELDRMLSARGAGAGGEGAPAQRLRRFLDSGAKARLQAAQEYLKASRSLAANPAAARWIDKMPGNFVHCGAIAALFPNARIIMTSRDPHDTMLSCLRTFFTSGQGFTESFERFAEFWRVQQDFAALWRELLGERVLEMRYEDMVADPLTQSRRLLAHVGLPWVDGCDAPELGGGVVQTASAFQVRAPIHTGSVGGWRRYEAEFAPLTDFLRQAGWDG